MIEGKTGVIVVDTGDCVEQARWQHDDLRGVCGKPVAALIYTHSHYAFGSRVWVAPQDEGKVPVWAHPDLMQIVLRTVGDLSPFIVRRVGMQFGMHLPERGPRCDVAPRPRPLPARPLPLHAHQRLRAAHGQRRRRPTGRDRRRQGAVLPRLGRYRRHAADLAARDRAPSSTTSPGRRCSTSARCAARSFRNPIELLKGLDKIIELAARAPGGRARRADQRA